MKTNILIVEDEPSIAENIRFALEREGFSVTWHSEGGGVLSLLTQQPIDLIILDIGLPDINGLEVCKAVQKEHDLPIIFLTARSDEVDRIVGLEIGADDYVIKPFSPRELTARVKAVLRRTQQKKPQLPSATHSTFHIDQLKWRIAYCGQGLELSRYEYLILKALCEHAGQVFSREHLMEKIWDEPETSLDRTVDAHIKNIRAKLKKITPEKDPIQTHRGLGYSLKED